MRDVRRHMDEIAWTRLSDKLEPIAPAHTGAPADHIDHALDGPMMVSAGLGLGMDDNRSRPELLGAHARVGDRCGATHSGRLPRVQIQVVGAHDTDAVTAPLRPRRVMPA